MPRPRKCRRVCGVPHSPWFGPLSGGAPGGPVVEMTVEEYETIRQIDLEGLTQEQCAERMGVARTTAQAIYAAARQKLARCLVQGCALCITGGDYVVCAGEGDGHGCGCCRRHCGPRPCAQNKKENGEQ